jgi:hypothetical protein
MDRALDEVKIGGGSRRSVRRRAAEPWSRGVGGNFCIDLREA